MARTLDEYITKINAICESRKDSSQSIIMSTKHMVRLMEIMSALQKAIKICGDKHKDSGHQQQTIEVIDHMIRDLDDTDQSLH